MKTPPKRAVGLPDTLTGLAAFFAIDAIASEMTIKRYNDGGMGIGNSVIYGRMAGSSAAAHARSTGAT